MQIIAGIHRHRKLIAPKALATRPTFSRLKKTLFDICMSSVQEALFLDLFAGIGNIGLEALSRGAHAATFVEKDKKAADAIRENIHLLKEESRATLLTCDVFVALNRLKRENKSFDIIFADPPYGSKEGSLSNEVLTFIDSSSLLKEGGELFLEDAIEASVEEPLLTSLRLKSKRRIGRAILRHYFFSSEP